MNCISLLPPFPPVPPVLCFELFMLHEQLLPLVEGLADPVTAPVRLQTKKPIVE